MRQSRDPGSASLDRAHLIVRFFIARFHQDGLLFLLVISYMTGFMALILVSFCRPVSLLYLPRPAFVLALFFHLLRSSARICRPLRTLGSSGSAAHHITMTKPTQPAGPAASSTSVLIEPLDPSSSSITLNDGSDSRCTFFMHPRTSAQG
jgi:hypothetical protein